MKSPVRCAAALLAVVLGGCGTAPPARSAPEAAGGRDGLTDAEVAKAVAAARRELASQGATITSAAVTARPGVVRDPNAGHPCLSGRVLNVKLIGDFPGTVTTGHPVPGNGAGEAEDFTVHAVLLTVDAASGRPCRVGVQTGPVRPAPGATALHID